MNKVTIGLLVGLVLGLAVGAYMSTANEFAVLASCIGTGLAGALAGLSAERSANRLVPIAVGAVVGALAWWYVARGGQPGTAALVGAVLGAAAGGAVGFLKRPLGPTVRPEPVRPTGKVANRNDTCCDWFTGSLSLGFLAALVYLFQDPGLQALVRGWLADRRSTSPDQGARTRPMMLE